MRSARTIAIGLALPAIAGCNTTQQKAAWVRLNSARLRASELAVKVKTPSHVVVVKELLAVPGSTGLGSANPAQPEEPIDILILLNIGAVFLGTALTVRDLVGERMIFQRERAVGLSASAYLMAKIIVYSTAALIGTAVMVAIMTIGKGTPAHGGALLGPGVPEGVLELYLGLAFTAIASAR